MTARLQGSNRGAFLERMRVYALVASGGERHDGRGNAATRLRGRELAVARALHPSCACGLRVRAQHGRGLGREHAHGLARRDRSGIARTHCPFVEFELAAVDVGSHGSASLTSMRFLNIRGPRFAVPRDSSPKRTTLFLGCHRLGFDHFEVDVGIVVGREGRRRRLHHIGFVQRNRRVFFRVADAHIP